MITQNSIMHLLIAKSVARTGTTALDPAAATYLVDGEVAVVDLDGTILNSTTVIGKPRVRIIQSQGAALPSIQSPEIEQTGVKTYTMSGAASSNGYVAPALQTDYIGYNVTTNAGDIDVINSNGYEVLIHDIGSMAYGSVGVDKFGFYVSGAAATKTSIWDGMALNLYQNTTKVIRKPFIVERVASIIAGTDTTGAAGTLTFVQGSDVVTASVSSTGNGIAVGAYVKNDDVAVDTGVYYKVTEIISATTFRIDIPYQAAGAAFTAGNASVYTAALMNAGSLGIKLTALTPVFVSPQSTNYYVNRWIPSLRNFGATTVTNTVIGTEGVGTYAAVASLEYFLIGNEGFIARNVIPYINPRANALAASTYGFITLEWDSLKTGSIFNGPAASKQLLIAFDTAATSRQQVTGVVTSVQTVLNAWIGATPGPFADLTLV